MMIHLELTSNSKKKHERGWISEVKKNQQNRGGK